MSFDPYDFAARAVESSHLPQSTRFMASELLKLATDYEEKCEEISELKDELRDAQEELAAMQRQYERI